VTFLGLILEPIYRTQNLYNVTCFMHQAFFLGKAKVVAKCLIRGSSTQLKYALDPDELVNDFVSRTIANLSLAVNLEPPSH